MQAQMCPLLRHALVTAKNMGACMQAIVIEIVHGQASSKRFLSTLLMENIAMMSIAPTM